MKSQENIVEELVSVLSSTGERLKAEQMEKYMKDLFPFLGVVAADRRAILNAWYKLHKNEILPGIRKYSKLLFDLEFRELQYCGMDLLARAKRQLESNDIDLIEHMLITKPWWDTVDFVASHFVGELFHDKALRDSKTKEWMSSDNMWLQRACILHQLKYKDKVDTAYLFKCIDEVKHSDEFFLQKANGWALRQLSKFNAETVRSYLAQNPDLPRVTTREAKKYI